MTSSDDYNHRIEAILSFLNEADGLKRVYRANYLGDQSRHESSAEHTWHAVLFAILLHRELSLDADLAHVVELLVVHDLVEVYAGDVSVHDVEARAHQPVRERAAADRLFALLPADQAALLRGWWDEFEEATTPEAAFAREIDRLDAIAQNVLTQGRSWAEVDATEQDVRDRNQSETRFRPETREVFELLIQKARIGQMFAGDQPKQTS